MLKTCFRMAAAAVLALAVVTPAYGQATRTWVSGVGDDVNPCSRTAPCKTFAGAISKTAAGGEINCLDPGGFGAVTITKSITIDCTGTFGSVLNSGGVNGIVINDSATATPGTINVILRGLSINGAGTTAGLNGVRFISGASLTLEDVFIQNQRNGATSHGVSIQPTTAMRFHAENVTIVNGTGGILLNPTVAGGSISAAIENVRVLNNTGNGIRVENLLSTVGVTLVVERSLISRNASGFSVNTANSTTPVNIMIANSSVTLNPSNGIIASNAGSRIRIGDTTVTGNGFGVQISGGAILNSYGTNRFNGNVPELAIGGTPITEQ
ncbi:hypothetical protein [Sphingosinicella sp. YJ22]|uniref:hypothetical protein n=1 Tax=Sphingosinicella sp. YJ22 TaxID=1104780 RepID=UPI001A9C9C56|nr:hypothetical protein [Sphingosinicella sp. YJ22]